MENTQETNDNEDTIPTSLTWWKASIASMINQQLNPANSGGAEKG